MRAEGAYGEDYFRSGNYGRLNTGWTGRYFWARRFYAALVRRYCPAGRVLEIGCGLGHALARLQDRYEACGIDISPYAIDAAKSIAPRAELKVMPAENIGEFGEDSFNAILAVHVFEHLEDPRAVARSCREVLAPDGVLIMGTPNLEAPLRGRKGRRWHGYKDPTHISLKPPGEWREIIGSTGLRVERSFGDGMWDVPYVPLVPAKLQLAILGLPAVLQTLACVPFIPPRLSESLIIVARKPGK
jgi:SAM-dependent methyltransferase